MARSGFSRRRGLPPALMNTFAFCGGEAHSPRKNRADGAPCPRFWGMAGELWATFSYLGCGPSARGRETLRLPEGCGAQQPAAQAERRRGAERRRPQLPLRRVRARRSYELGAPSVPQRRRDKELPESGRGDDVVLPLGVQAGDAPRAARAVWVAGGFVLLWPTDCV